MSDSESSHLGTENEAEDLPHISLQSGVSKERHPPIFAIVRSAIEATADRKGASVPGLKKWIAGTYPEIDQARLRGWMKVNLQKGLDSGEFLRPKNSEGKTSVMQGRYKIGKPPKKIKTAKQAAALKKKKKAKTKTKAKEEKTGKKTKTAEKPGDGDEETQPTNSSTPPRRPLTKRTKAISRAHSLSPKIRTSKSKKIRRSISLTPGKAVPRKARPTAKRAPKKSPKKSPVKSPAKKTATTKKAAKVTKKAAAADDDKKKKPVKETKAKTAVAKEKAEKARATKAKSDKAKTKPKRAAATKK